MSDPFTPVHVLTGFLGSGKTTLLRRLLANPALSGTLVLINEFGEIGLDHHLIERVDETAILLRSGCVCCAIRGDLARSLRDALSRRARGEMAFARVIIETSGLADPFPILATLKADPVLRHHVRMARVITTVDAVNAPPPRRAEALRQIAAADWLVLTKTDLVDADSATRVRSRISRINPDAPVVSGTFDTATLLDGGVTARRFYADDANSHLEGVCSFAMIVDDPIDWTAFGLWLTMLLHRHGEQVLRVKAILNVAGEAAPVALHGVRHLVHDPVHMASWPDADRRSRIVFIVDGIDPALIRRSFLAFNQIGAEA